MQGSANLNLMIKAARRAGKSLVKDFREVENLQVSTKGPGDFVSKADREAERLIKEDLMGARPTYGWLGEETGGEAGADPTRRWIVDPLDGTSNFLHGIPHFAISIAVEEQLTGGRREVTTGLVYNPITDESFWAEKGRGAWLQDQRLRVSARRDLSDALIATGIPFMGHGDTAEWVRIYGALATSVAGIRRFGAASLDLAWVAAGRYDGYWESKLQPWDVAAGMLLVREAGGFVTDFRGGERCIERREFLAANDGLHSKLHKLVANALR
jgi:myo-inositol-1(or 4)-monophosphatase